MNNEEKILEILLQMQNDYNRMQGSMGHMQGSIEHMNKRLDSIDERLGNVENEARKTNLIIEQDIEPKISLLFDGQVTNSETMQRMEERVNILTDIQEQHDIAIQAFRK